jgi:hypothetical protein
MLKGGKHSSLISPAGMKAESDQSFIKTYE